MFTLFTHFTLHQIGKPNVMIIIVRTLQKRTSPTSVTIVEVLEERLKSDQNGKTMAKELANDYIKGEIDRSRCRLKCTITRQGIPISDGLSDCDVIDYRSKVRYLSI